MKTIKRAVIVMLLVLLVPLYAMAQAEPVFSTSSGEQTADALVYTGRSAIASILVITDGSNDAKVVVYDSLTASGAVRYETTVRGTDHYGGRNWTFPVQCAVGVYVDVTGTDASYIVEYIQR